MKETKGRNDFDGDFQATKWISLPLEYMVNGTSNEHFTISSARWGRLTTPRSLAAYLLQALRVARTS